MTDVSYIEPEKHKCKKCGKHLGIPKHLDYSELPFKCLICDRKELKGDKE